MPGTPGLNSLCSLFFFNPGSSTGNLSYGTSYKTPPGRNIKKIERRTSNAQHRTSNIDDAALYRFKNDRTAEHSTKESSKGGQVSKS